MTNLSVSLYSPLTPKNVHGKEALLLQFILSELIYAKDSPEGGSSPAYLYPYHCFNEAGWLCKICEHARLLKPAFPDLEREATAFNEALGGQEKFLSQRSTLFSLLLPFLMSSKASETLLLFLLQHGVEIDKLARTDTLSDLLKKMQPKGHGTISQLLKKKYQARGFSALLPEIDRLLTSYE